MIGSSMAWQAGHYGNRRHRPTPTAVAWTDRGVTFHYADGSSLACYAPALGAPDRGRWAWEYRAEHLAAEVTA